MDPITLGLLMAMGAGGAAAVTRWRKRRKGTPTETAPTATTREPRVMAGEHRVGDVLLYMGEEYWLAGELALVREGSPALRLYSAPERGRDRWLAVPREGESLYVLRVDDHIAGLGWPGMEVPYKGLTLRPVEQGACAIVPSGEVEQRWEGLGRYAVFRSGETMAVVLEQGKQRLSLAGKSFPRRIFEKLG
jgi:hypothetical protein